MAKIEFIIPTYDRFNHLMCLLYSLKAQTNPNFKCNIILDDCMSFKLRNMFYQFVHDYVGEKDDRFYLQWTNNRFNDWGHTPRNMGLQEATADWVVMTGEDNYYVPTFVEEVLKVANDDVKFIYCDMVHNWIRGEYMAVLTRPITGQIDIGCCVYRREFAQQMRLDVTDKCADGKFCEEYNNRFKGLIVKINKFLYVHN